jgi:hypothetical protein
MGVCGSDAAGLGGLGLLGWQEAEGAGGCLTNHLINTKQAASVGGLFVSAEKSESGSKSNAATMPSAAIPDCSR